MCGSESPRLRPVLVEGTKLMLCERCARFGVEVRRPQSRRVTRPSHRSKAAARPSAESDFELAHDFGERIRKAREALRWKREELAKKINEKLSIVEKLEKGKIRPDDRLVSKLERVLRIRLRERIEEVDTGDRPDRRPITLGDLFRRQT